MPWSRMRIPTERRSVSFPKSAAVSAWIPVFTGMTLSVLYGAAVGGRAGGRHRLAGLELVECHGDVVRRFLHVVDVGGADAVDGAVVDHLAGAVDDEHVRSGLRAVGHADLAGL